MIRNSSMCSVYPLMALTDKLEKGSSGYHWVNLPPIVTGMSDFRPRAGTFTTPWNATSEFRSPLPDLSIPELSTLADLLDKRALEIYHSAIQHNKKIVVMWSGGIDSTTVLVSLLKNIPFNEQPDLLTVCMTPDSLVENFEFYKKFISARLQVVHKSTVDFGNDFLNKNILLHGDPADALFGPSSDKYRHLMPEQLHLLPYKDNIDLLYSCLPSATGKWLVDKIVANLDEVNLSNITSIADWFWWQYVNLKWEGSVWRPFHSTGIRKDFTSPITTENSKFYFDHVFFQPEYFQRWSYTNLHKLFPAHKGEAKKYILDFDHNELYYTSKGKSLSLQLNFINGTEQNHYAVPVYYNKDWVGFTLKDPGVYDMALTALQEYNG